MHGIDSSEPYTTEEEHVARDLCWANGLNPDTSLGGDQVNWLWHEYVYQARVAIDSYQRFLKGQPLIMTADSLRSSPEALGFRVSSSKDDSYD